MKPLEVPLSARCTIEVQTQKVEKHMGVVWKYYCPAIFLVYIHEPFENIVLASQPIHGAMILLSENNNGEYFKQNIRDLRKFLKRESIYKKKHIEISINLSTISYYS